MKEIAKEIIRQIGVVLGAFISFIRKMYEQDKNNRLLQEQMRQQQQHNDRILQHIYQVRCELYNVMQYCHYSNLVQVHTLNDIRIRSYSSNGNVCYFTIDKTDYTNQIPQVICDIICQDINRDIKNFQRTSLMNRPFDEIIAFFPNLYYGIQISNVQNQMNCVQIAVTTFINP